MKSLSPNAEEFVPQLSPQVNNFVNLMMDSIPRLPPPPPFHQVIISRLDNLYKIF